MNFVFGCMGTMHRKDPHDHMVCNCAQDLKPNLPPFDFCDNETTIGEVFLVASCWAACPDVAAARRRAVC